MEKLTLPITIIIASFILGGFFYASQLSKQQFIERQYRIELQTQKEANQIKLEQEKQAKMEAEKKQQIKLEQEKQAKMEAEKKQQIKLEQEKQAKMELLNNCINKADKYYFDWGNIIIQNAKNCKNKSTKVEEWACIVVSNDALKKARLEWKEEKENCFKKYPQN